MPRSTRKWTLWEQQLISVGRANGVPYKAMAAAFGVGRGAISGVIHRWFHPYSPAYRRPLRDPPCNTIQVTTRVDDETITRIDALRRRGQSRALVLRDLIEWGLEAAEL